MKKNNTSTTAKKDIPAKHPGRKPATENKAASIVQVYLTDYEKKALLAYCEQNGIAASVLIKQALRSKRIIPSLKG